MGAVQGHSVGWRGVEHEAPAPPAPPVVDEAHTAGPTLLR
jgi:hypothetical protein